MDEQEYTWPNIHVLTTFEFHRVIYRADIKTSGRIRYVEYRNIVGRR